MNFSKVTSNVNYLLKDYLVFQKLVLSIFALHFQLLHSISFVDYWKNYADVYRLSFAMNQMFCKNDSFEPMIHPRQARTIVKHVFIRNEGFHNICDSFIGIKAWSFTSRWSGTASQSVPSIVVMIWSVFACM